MNISNEDFGLPGEYDHRVARMGGKCAFHVKTSIGEIERLQKSEVIYRKPEEIDLDPYRGKRGPMDVILPPGDHFS